MFLDELEQRSSRLSAASTSITGGDAAVVDLPTNRRERHTVKGTACVMGIEKVRRCFRQIPIVRLSGTANEDDRIRAKKAGIDRFFARSAVREGVMVSIVWDFLES